MISNISSIYLIEKEKQAKHLNNNLALISKILRISDKIIEL
jgi:hypothetical protein